jgi:enamine deaminase RidA (YjgF/YER057c/UK114 family)
MTERTIVQSESPWEAVVGYSRATRVGDLVWVAGTTGSGGSAGEQTRTALERVAAALEQVGASMADVVRTRIFTTDISLWEEIGREHSRVFDTVRPVATMVGVARLITPELLVEIEVEAVVGSGR